jgi:hypothetical protein
MDPDPGTPGNGSGSATLTFFYPRSTGSVIFKYKILTGLKGQGHEIIIG